MADSEPEGRPAAADGGPSSGAEDFAEMYRETLPIVYGFLSVRLAGDRAVAEDLTADTYAAAAARYRAGAASEVTTGWLLTVARRRLIDHWRRRSVAQQKAVRLVEPSSEDPPALEEREAVIDALARLSEAERTALVLQHVEGHSVREVADIVGRSVKATESLLARARRAFRSTYGEVTDG